ncbi:MAG: MotA/TolQ/ExbB proton channel family protein [Kofleriaceae bacterium]|nr:MotA/TolQ/ExbB proton channel family protein [Kofleriaceae bacterium]
MDIASAIGFVLGMGLVLVTIIMGSPLSAFFNVPGLAIVVGGTFATVFMAEGIKQVIGAGKVGAQAFFGSAPNVNETIAKIAELAVVVRKEGLLALENQEINDPFLAKGVRLAVDGIPPEEVEATLAGEMATMKDRHKRGSQLYKFAGANAPAMGMIGTLIGLVQMLQSLDDPAAIGPAMAVALLTTFYGAVMAFMMFGPMAEKLDRRSEEEAENMKVVIIGLESILKGENGRIVKEKLEGRLPPSLRTEEEN